MFRHRHHGGGGHHRHHHRHHPIARAVVTGLVAGAVVSAFTPSRRQTVYVPASPVRYESPEEREARERFQREQWERQKKAEADRLAEQERLRQAALIAEDQWEQHRVNEYAMHQTLIRELDGLAATDLINRVNALPRLAEPIKRYENSPYRDIPRVDGKHLLGKIIFNDSLTSDVKSQVLETLIQHKSYDKYMTELFLNRPIYAKMLESQPLFDVLNRVYRRYIVNTGILPLDVERNFWQACLKNPGINPVDFCKIHRHQAKKFQMLADWLNSQTKAIDVINIYDKIQAREFGLSTVYLTRFLKIAKQKILSIEIQQNSTQHEGLDDRTVRDFLDINRSTWTSCFSCLFTRRSVDIHSMIQRGQTYLAANAWNAEEKTLDNEFYKRRGLVR